MTIKYRDPQFAHHFLTEENKALYPEQYNKVLDSLDSDDLGRLLCYGSIYFRSTATQTITTYLALGANLQMQDEYGLTPLHLAALYGHGEAIQLLLKAGAYKEAKDQHGRTPWDISRFIHTTVFRNLQP